MKLNTSKNIPKIYSDQRVFIAGKTGSGKTLLAMSLLYTARRLLVIDSKDGLQDWNLEDLKNIKQIDSRKDYRLRVVDDEKAIEALERLYDVGNGVVYIDELTALVPTSKEPPRSFTNIWSRGRSRNIGAWASTQRPKSIPLLTISEAEHFFIFRLQLEADRQRVAEVVGEFALKPVRDKHGFYYYNVDNDDIRYYNKLRLKVGEST